MWELSWQPSAGLRAVKAATGIAGSAAGFLVYQFFYSHTILVTIMATYGALLVVFITAPVRVTLSPGQGEVRIRVWRFARRLPLTEITSVDESLGRGPAIKTGNVTYSFLASRRLHWLERRLRIRTGFDGMEMAIT